MRIYQFMVLNWLYLKGFKHFRNRAEYIYNAWNERELNALEAKRQKKMKVQQKTYMRGQ